MIKNITLRLLGVSLLGVAWAGVTPVAMADPAAQGSSSGTTTYFPPPDAAKDKGTASTGAPATTAALPTPADPPKAPPSSTAAASPSTPTSTTPAPPAANATPDTPPSSGTAAGTNSGPQAAPTPPTSTAIVTPPATNAPAATPAPPVDSKSATTPPAPSSSPPTDTAQQPKAAEPTPVVAAPPPPPPVSPIVEAARSKLSDKSLIGRANTGDDVNAARDYYGSHTDPLWVKDGTFTHKARQIIETLKGADDWGLDSSDFTIPAIDSGASAGGAAEAQLTLSALKYARFARGGRLDPISLSNMLDMKPPVKDSRTVMRELANASDPGAFLRGLNPKHVGFERLRQALLKARGSQEAVAPVDPALLVKIPNGKTLKRGAKDDQVSLLRQRLKIPADDPANETVYDDKIAAAIQDIQRDNGLKSNGLLTNRVRSILNSAGQPKEVDPTRYTDRLISNMERWRWLPTDLGKFYVMNNIPEFTSEIWKDDRIELKQKIIVGQPSWPTPLLQAKMQFVIFHPSWGMPDGIKQKELMPRLRQAAGNSTGFGFFDQLFGGGSYSAADVIDAYKLQVYYNGQRVDPKSVDWRSADLRQYSFIQPPGGDNPLGLVKFRFPNSHDVYMHDTPERNLFGQSMRALSHGCMRVEEPRRTAEVILGEDKGYPPEKVGELWDSGASVTLSKEVPVYLVYFTARVGDDGQLDNYSDVYGIDDRIMSALRGHPVRFVAQEALDPTEASEPGGRSNSGGADAGAGASNDAYPGVATGASSVSDAGSDDLQDAPPPKKKSGKKSAASKKQPNSGGSSGNTVQDALSNIFLN